MNMNEMQAALGLSQLKKLPRFKTKRVQLLKHYHKLLENVPHVKPLKMTEGTVPHIAVVLIDYEKVGKTKRGDGKVLLDKQIGAQVHYTSDVSSSRLSIYLAVRGRGKGTFLKR